MANWGQYLWGLWPWGGGPAAVTADVSVTQGHHSVSASGYESVFGNVSVTSPAHTVEVLAGNNVAVVSPMHTVEVTGLVEVIATVEVSQPRDTVSASGLVSVVATVEVTEPMHILTAVLTEGIVGVVEVTSPMPYPSSIALIGSLATVEVTAPGHKVSVSTTVVPVGTIDMTMPMHTVEVIAIVEAALSFTGVVVNTENFSNTVYSSYPFNSFCLFNEIYFGATADGIYSLTGDDDAGTDIDAVAKTGTIDTGRDSKVVPREAWLTGRFKSMKVRIYPGEGDPYEQSINEDGDGPREARVKFGRGHKERYFAWELLNKEGGDFDIDSFNVLAERKGALPLRRR